MVPPRFGPIDWSGFRSSTDLVLGERRNSQDLSYPLVGIAGPWRIARDIRLADGAQRIVRANDRCQSLLAIRAFAYSILHIGRIDLDSAGFAIAGQKFTGARITIESLWNGHCHHPVCAIASGCMGCWAECRPCFLRMAAYAIELFPAFRPI